MQLTSLPDCKLAIGSYPIFSYNASNGGGQGTIKSNSQDGLQNIWFDPIEFNVPPLNSKTTRLLGVPLPPGIEINIFLDLLEGTIDQLSGEISLQFEARFRLDIFHWIKAPHLSVKTCLSSGTVKSKYHNLVQGQKLQSNNQARLVGVALIPKSGNPLLDAFLGLPNEALAILCCELHENRN